MSVWASFSVLDGEEGQSRPIRYRRSHVVPSLTDERDGSVDLGYIPGFVTRDGRDDGPEDGGRAWPFLRLHVSVDDMEGMTVVLDAEQVEFLRDQLAWWLERVAP